MKTNLKLLVGIIGIAAVLAGLAAIPQAQKETPHVQTNAIEARPEDVSSIPAIVKATYETISGGVGVPRQWDRDRSLFDPNARLVSVGVDPKTKAVVKRSLSHQEYMDAADPFMVREGFTEHELGHEIKQFGNVATVLSSYEGTAASTGKVVGRGVNIFQLYFDGKRWWILSITWDQERPDNPIPPELLPKS